MDSSWRTAFGSTAGSVPMALSVLMALAVGCDAPEPTRPAESAPVRAETASRTPLLDAERVSGVYQVHGVTVQAANGLVREIDGILRLHLDGGSFSTTFELETSVPGAEAGFRVSVVGWGQGLLVGDTMAGTVSSRMVRLDEPSHGRVRLPAEELVIMSSSIARFNTQGLLQVELQNQPGIDQQYSPSVTVLEGKRTGPLRETS